MATCTSHGHVYNFTIFKATTSLPTAEETGLSAQTIEEANKAVCKGNLTDQRSTSLSQSSSGKKRKYTTMFTPEIWAKIGHYAEGWSNAIIFT